MQKGKRATTVSAIIALTALLYLPITGQEQEPIHENVSVVNYEVVCRVYDAGGKPVSGLTKKDFILRVNGRDHVRGQSLHGASVGIRE